MMEKQINGKVYVSVKQDDEDITACESCALLPYHDACRAAGNDCINDDFIWKLKE